MSDKSNLTYRLFEHVFGENREMLERLAYFYVGSREDAEDIVSQSFLNLWEKREDILEDRILPYLFTTVKNACLDYRRKESVHKQTHEQLQREGRKAVERHNDRRLANAGPNAIDAPGPQILPRVGGHGDADSFQRRGKHKLNANAGSDSRHSLRTEGIDRALDDGLSHSSEDHAHGGDS